MKTAKAPLKALWAFEPFHQDSTRVKGMYNLLRQLAIKPTHIEVGFIVTRTENKLNLAFDIPYEERFSAYPRKILKNILHKAKVSIDDKKIHVVDHETFSDTKAVDQLLALAKSRDSNLIALYTHAYQGFMRLALGSFAETTIHRSKTNLLLVNPKTKFSLKIKNILYTSDFSPVSQKHLSRVIQLCKKVGSRLTVFHAAEIIYKHSLDESNPKVHAYRRKLARMQAQVEQECKKAGVSCEVIISSELGPITELVLNIAEKARVDMIVVSAKMRPALALMGGSITRQIIRSSSKPVLILK